MLDRVLAPQRRVVAAIVERLLPPAPTLAPEIRQMVAAHATRFVVIEIESIPRFLRAPYLAAIFVFEWLAAARYLRPYTRLGVEAQQAYLDFWSNNPLGPLRDFVKLIRGCALLAYFDHPAVRGALDRERPVLEPVLERARLAAD